MCNGSWVPSFSKEKWVSFNSVPFSIVRLFPVAGNRKMKERTPRSKTEECMLFRFSDNL
jgi:hypothetical protein